MDVKDVRARTRSRSGGRTREEVFPILPTVCTGNNSLATGSSSPPSSSTSGSTECKPRPTLRRTRWLALRSALEEEFGIDSWSLRHDASSSAAIVGTLTTGEGFQVVGEVCEGEWLKVSVERSGQQLMAYVARYFIDPSSGTRLEAFVPSGAPELCEKSARPSKQTVLNAVERTESALEELVRLRRSYEQLGVSDRDVVRAQASRKIERVMQELDFLGVPFHQVLNCQDPMTLLLRARSFQHRSFENPLAETCWLSCLFQSLWHSVVFHAAFELYLAPSRCTPAANEKLLTALQKTWAKYQQEVEEDDDDLMGQVEPPRLVPTQDLVEGFGEGYGDMSEALASIQNELSESKNAAAVKISELIVLIPLSTLDGAWPTPAVAWKQAEEWQVTRTPIIAVDLSLPEITLASSRQLAKLWTPKPKPRTDAAQGDLGPGHRIMAVVCYMWNYRHYVTFCRRQQDDSRCLFFNDLPGLTHGAPAEVSWQEIPNMCYQYALTPRLALYESLGAAEEVVRNLRAAGSNQDQSISSPRHVASTSNSIGTSMLDPPIRSLTEVATNADREEVRHDLTPARAQESREMCRQQ